MTVKRLEVNCSNSLATHCSLARVGMLINITHEIFHRTVHEFFCTNDTGEVVILSKSSVSNYCSNLQVAGVHPRQVHTNCDGTLDLADIANKVRSPCDAHQPVSCLICVEQTHNATGGRVLSLDYLQKVRDFPLELFCSVSHLKLITQIMLGENGLSPGVTYLD